MFVAITQIFVRHLRCKRIFPISTGGEILAGSFDYNPYPPQLALDATPIGVFLYDSSAADGQGYTLLPNVRCDQIQYKEGIEPPAARFSYILDEVAAINNGWPSQFDQIWPLTVTPSPYVVANDDELVVLAFLPDNTTRVLFHGFARVPQTDLIAGEPERHVRRGRRGDPLLEHADRRTGRAQRR